MSSVDMIDTPVAEVKLLNELPEVQDVGIPENPTVTNKHEEEPTLAMSTNLTCHTEQTEPMEMDKMEVPSSKSEQPPNLSTEAEQSLEVSEVNGKEDDFVEPVCAHLESSIKSAPATTTLNQDNIKITQKENQEVPVPGENSELSEVEPTKVLTSKIEEHESALDNAVVEEKEEAKNNNPKAVVELTGALKDNIEMETSEQEVGNGCVKGDEDSDKAEIVVTATESITDAVTDASGSGPEVTSGEGRQVVLEIIDDRVAMGKKPPVRYRKVDDTYDSDSSTSVSSDEPSIHLSSDSEEEVIVPEKEKPANSKGTKKKGPKKDLFEVDVRTKGELTFEELPPLQELKIDVDPKVVLMEVGAVRSILGPIVIVQANKMVPALDQDTILFNENRTPIGQVFETFGPVPAPLYVVRFNSAADIVSRDVQVGNAIFYAPDLKEYTRFVFVAQLKQLHGSDASWEHNNEPPDKHLDYSDDEAERKARHKNRGNENDENEEDAPETEKKWRKRKPRQQNNSSEGGGSQQKRPHQKQQQQQQHGTAWPPSGPTGWGQPAPPGTIPQWPPTPPPGGVGYRHGPQPMPPSPNAGPGGPWGMPPGHRQANPGQSPHGAGPPGRGWRPAGQGWPNQAAGPPCPNGFGGGGGGWPNHGGFGAPPGSVHWPPNAGCSPGPPTAGGYDNVGSTCWPPKSMRGQAPSPGPPPQWPAMDMRFVQNGGPGPSPGAEMGPLGPHPISNWSTAGPPRPPPFRPAQFGGPPNFSTWG